VKLASTRRLPPDDEIDPELPDIPPWSESYPAQEGEWVYFRSFRCLGSAEAIAGLLEAQNVPSIIDPPWSNFWFSLAVFHVWVDARMAHRAHWLLEEDAFTDAELCYLATGTLPGHEPE
jgi:hypothetical protein